MKPETVVRLLKTMEDGLEASRKRSFLADLQPEVRDFEFGFRAGMTQAMAFLIDAQEEE